MDTLAHAAPIYAELPRCLLRANVGRYRPGGYGFHDGSYARLRTQIKHRGITSPLLVVERELEYVIVDGHRRNAIALELAIPVVPCLVYRCPLPEAGEPLRCIEW